MFGSESKDKQISKIFADFWIFCSFSNSIIVKLVLFSLGFTSIYLFSAWVYCVLFSKIFFQMFVALKLDEKVGFCYHYDKPNEPIVKWATEKAIKHLTKDLVQKPLRGPSGTRTPSPRCSTPRWRKHSRQRRAEWKEPSATPSKLPGIVVIWTLCKDFSAIPSAIPRENPRILNLLPWLQTNCSFSWSPAR